MKLSHRGMFIALAVTAIFFLATTGCTKYASPDDLQRLESSRQATLSAEKERDQMNDQIRKLERDTKAKDDSLQAVRNEFKLVKSR